MKLDLNDTQAKALARAIQFACDFNDTYYSFGSHNRDYNEGDPDLDDAYHGAALQILFSETGLLAFKDPDFN